MASIELIILICQLVSQQLASFQKCDFSHCYFLIDSNIYIFFRNVPILFNKQIVTIIIRTRLKTRLGVECVWLTLTHVDRSGSQWIIFSVHLCNGALTQFIHLASLMLIFFNSRVIQVFTGFVLLNTKRSMRYKVGLYNFFNSNETQWAFSLNTYNQDGRNTNCLKIYFQRKVYLNANSHTAESIASWLSSSAVCVNEISRLSQRTYIGTCYYRRSFFHLQILYFFNFVSGN